MPADELRRVGYFGNADGAAADFRRLARGLYPAGLWASTRSREEFGNILR